MGAQRRQGGIIPAKGRGFQWQRSSERLSGNFRELASRARKAGFLVLGGNVKLAPPGTVQGTNGRYHRTAVVLAWVTSEWTGRQYVLTRGVMGRVICNCPDARPEHEEVGAPPSRIAVHTCKHILAAGLEEA
jgi:hypothetical protein